MGVSTAWPAVSAPRCVLLNGSAVPTPTPLPDDLPAVLRLDAAARLGLSRGVLRGSRFEHAGRDLYVHKASLPLSLLDRCRALAMVVHDDAVFSHATAALLNAQPVPLRLQQADVVHVSRARDDIPPRRLGIFEHEMELPPDHVCVRHGLRVTSPARTMLDLANELSLVELVAIGDVVVGQELATREQLRRLAAWARGRRGVTRFRRALPHLDGRAESPPESYLRVWLAECRLPRMTPQVPVRDSRGVEVARPDLLNDEFQVVGEYEGAYHRDRDQFAADIARRERLVSLGFDVVQVEAGMLARPADVVHRFAQAFRRRGWTGDYTLAGLAP